ARPGVVLLDKTGTLTRGEVRLVSFDGPPDALDAAAAVEAEGTHAVARAFVAAADEAGRPRPPATDVEHVLGHGARGTVGGVPIVVGSGRFVRAFAAGPPSLEAAERRVLERGLPPVLVARGGEVVAVAGLGDPVRGDAREAVQALRALGHELAIVSGDHPRLVRAVADQLGIERAEGSATPERKVKAVAEARARGAC